ncbi:hypothetical protein [Stieleria mannarensis]|uniref:hypothetical protein n=1 Tax=Stieleria mannarensis TaxID=2755585 RepID=UPI0016018F9B|nr:hypothetical protein [Rhodopirellula sp. JC639]
MARQVGMWTTHGVRNEKPFEGLYLARWNDAETGLIIVSREGHHVMNGLSYWDDKAAELIEVWATPSGSAVLHFNRRLGLVGRVAGVVGP